MIHALVVAIDKYPIKHHELNGCVNDAKSMVAYLEGNYECEELNIKTLFDDQATRANVIDAFSHFQNAKPEDTCLLYYSGHGSQAASPPEFRHLDPDGKVETIVCHDSRLPGGFDLIDKELSYLIWEATEKNNPHFVAIFDCCNSGTNTRGLNDKTVKARMAETARNIPQGRTTHGNASFATTIVEGKTQLTPPRGRHVQLAAARPNQLAKELKIGDETRGAFTYNLIALLEQYNGRITYSQLISNLKARVNNYVSAQVPQIDAKEPTDKNLEFLGAIPQNRAESYSVNYDKKKKSWKINAGAIHNWPKDRAAEIKLAVKSGSKEIPVTVTKVGIVASFLNEKDLKSLDQEKSYLASIKSIPIQLVKLAFAPKCDANAKSLLTASLKASQSPYLTFVEDKDEADYWMDAFNGSMRLIVPGDNRPLFRRVEGYNENNANVFIADTEKIAKWNHVKDINNPLTTISNKDYNINLYKINQPGAWQENDDCPATLVENWREGVVFNYDYDKENEEWLLPAYRLEIENKGKRDLYFSAVALLTDFTISNQFLPGQVLEQNEKVLLREIETEEDENTGKVETNTYLSIPLSIPDALIAYDINEISQRIKLFISTVEIDTDVFNQEGVELDTPQVEDFGTRGMGRGAKKPAKDDWLVEDIIFNVVRPVKEKQVNSGEEASINDSVTISMPNGVSGLVTLNGRADATRNLSDSTPLPDFPAGWTDQDLGEGTHLSSPANILELYQVEGMENINADNPIKITLPKVEGNEFLVPVGFDPETGLYFPLGVMEEDGTVLIEDLPVPTTSGTRSLGGSIKIFFQKKVGKYLPFVYNHPQLAVCSLVPAEEDTTAAAGLKVEYSKILGNTNQKDNDPVFQDIKKAVGEANRIAIYIHGIIGDTTEMPKSAQLVKDATGKVLQDNYDLLLTFDYENLETSIKQTAQDLKDRLAALGLSAGHDKTLHIIAHSMGGLVSRWFIEKLEGNQIVSHLYQLGTPNQGSPYGSLYEMATPLLANAVNGAAFVQPYIIPLRVVGKFMDKMFTTLKEMNPDSDFLKELNDESDPGIPYTIIAGNTQLIAPKQQEQQLGLIKKVMNRFKSRGHYDALDLLLFKAPNDIAVSTESISVIPGGDNRQFPPTVLTCACDHISYFGDPAGLDSMRIALLES